jgi:hypothetical protein
VEGFKDERADRHKQEIDLPQLLKRSEALRQRTVMEQSKGKALEQGWQGVSNIEQPTIDPSTHNGE